MAKKSNKSEFVSGMGVGFEIVKALSDDVRSRGGSDEDLRRIVTDGVLRGHVADFLVGRLRVQARDRITVPVLSADKLVEQAQSKLNLTYLNPDLARRGFVTDEAGKTYEVLVWAPGRYVTTDEVRKHFEALKADGNTAAFVAWITENNPKGWYVSIPSDDSRLFPGGDGLCAPRFYRGDDGRGLSLGHVDVEWSDDCRFVAFREVK